MREKGGNNLYVFVNNAPITFIDFIGLHAELGPFPYTGNNGTRAHNSIFKWIRDQEYSKIRVFEFDRAFQWMGLGLSRRKPDIIDKHQKKYGKLNLLLTVQRNIVNQILTNYFNI